MSLAVVIPTRNMAATLGQAVGSACHGGADEVVVVDDASDDDTTAVVEQWQHEFSCVRYIRHKGKAEDHNAAQRDAWLSLTSKQVVGMGADDYLLPGAIAALKQHSDAAVVFGDADTVDEEGRFMYPHASSFYGVRTALEVRQRIRSKSDLIESGCGSALRSDIVKWLWTHSWHEMGPLMDSVGYGTAAALFGAAYVQAKTVVIAVRKTSYGSPTMWREEDLQRYATIAIAFMRYVGLDEETVRALSAKRCYVQW